LGEGEISIDSGELMQSLATFVTAVVARLDEKGISDTALTKEWRELESIDPDEAEYCRAVARLGLDPYVGNGAVRDAILRAAAELPSGLLGEFLDAVDPHKIDSGIRWIQRARDIVQSSARTIDELRSLRSEVPKLGTEPWHRTPWQTGWHQARLIRGLLGHAADQVLSLDSLLPTDDASSGDHGLIGLGGIASDDASLFLLGRSVTRESKKFNQGRALWNLLFRQVSDNFLITSSHTDRQKVERAFAAELLAPAEGIRDQLGVDPDVAGDEDLEQVAAHFGVSSVLVCHQVENQLAA
jgi:hypothetical protein